MQQIYGRTPIPNFTQITFWHEFSPINLLYIFIIPFPKNTSGGMLLLLKIQYTAKAPEGNMIEECLFYKRGYEIMIGWLTFCELINLNVG